MFSGIVEEVGKVLAVTDTSDGRRLRIEGGKLLDDLNLGDSVSVSGVCLTACQLGQSWFEVEAVHETLRCTKIGDLKVGDPINLERALRLNDRVGGHLVSGHVDGLGTVRSIKPEGFSQVTEISVASPFAPFFIEKGSVTLDGVSLTVFSLDILPGKNNDSAKASEMRFSVALIPHTLEMTTLSRLKVGDKVNIEVDIIGKYVNRLYSQGWADKINKGETTTAFVTEQGYTNV